MENENTNEHSGWRGKHWHRGRRHGFFGGVYGLAFLGALIYYLQHATTFGMGILGFFKAIFWPAVLIYKVYSMLGM